MPTARMNDNPDNGLDFAALFSAVPVRLLVLRADAPAYTIISATQAYLDTVGRTLQSLVGRPIFEAFADSPSTPYPDLDALRDSLARVHRQSATDDLPSTRHDAQTATDFMERDWVPANFPLFDGQGHLAYILHRIEDATDRVRMGGDRVESERRFRALVANVPGMVFRAESTAPWRLSFASEGMERLTGWRPDEFMEQDGLFQSLVHEDDLPRITREISVQTSAGLPIISEYRIRCRDGSVRWVEGRARMADDAPGIFEGTVMDIDERKHAELALLESEENFRHTVGSVPSLLWTARPDGRLDFISEAVGRITGVAPQELIEDGWARLLHPDDQAACIEDWRKAVVVGAPYETYFRLRLASGDHHTFQSQARPRRDEQGRIVRWYGVSHDIEELVQARARAEQAARARSAFLSAMSHEIRTPLNAVLGFAGLLADTDLNRAQRDFVGSIRASGDHLLRVINDILDFSKLESGSLALTLAPCRPHALLSSALQLVSHQAAQRKLQLLGQVEPGVPSAFLADERRLRQILVNLLSNGVKFTPRGSVEARVRAHRLDGDAYELEFQVRDTGIGIPQDRLERLFQDFSQVDDSIARRFGGTGLGLAISRRLVEAHGGRLTVESQPDAGSTFSFRIPARAVEPLAEGPSDDGLPDPASRAPTAPMRLLVVEDNLVNRKLALLILGKLGYRNVDTAVDGLEALAALSTVDYDVVLMDVQMPALDGLSCTRRIRAELPPERQPQIIAMTANAMTEDRAACAEAGMDDYLPKPIHLASLAQALLDAGRRRGIAVSEHRRPESVTESPELRAQRIATQVMAGGGDMGALMRGIDWSQTPIGPPYTWPQPLRTALSILLAQRHPLFLWWGRDLVQFYNDAMRPILGRTKHPRAMGQRGRECFAEVWDQVGPLVDAVFNRAEASWVERGLLCLDRNGLVEECYFTYSYSPIRNESGDVGGVFVACSENTAEVIAARRSALLLELDECAAGSQGPERQRRCIGGAVHDLPFTLLYRFDEHRRSARLAWATGLAPGSDAAPTQLGDDNPAWGVHESARSQRVLLQSPPAALPALPPWPEPPRQALVHPLGRWGVLVAGLSPRLIVDPAYRTFVMRVAQRLQRMPHAAGEFHLNG